MSQGNVDVVKRGYELFFATGAPSEEVVAPGFVWDMSTFGEVLGLKEQYEGIEGMREFLRDWTDPFEEWSLEVEEFRDAGDMVVAICRQRGRSKMGGVPVDMRFAQVWTVRDGLEARMEMYSDVDQALEAVGLKD